MNVLNEKYKMKKIEKFREELQSKVVRMEAMETQLGLEINHLTFITEPDSESVTINFEVIATNGSSISDNIEFNFAFYDSKGNITEKDSIFFNAEKFRGFSIESGSFDLNTYAKNISKIVFYLSVF